MVPFERHSLTLCTSDTMLWEKPVTFAIKSDHLIPSRASKRVASTQNGYSHPSNLEDHHVRGKIPEKNRSLVSFNWTTVGLPKICEWPNTELLPDLRPLLEFTCDLLTPRHANLSGSATLPVNSFSLWPPFHLTRTSHVHSMKQISKEPQNIEQCVCKKCGPLFG